MAYYCRPEYFSALDLAEVQVVDVLRHCVLAQAAGPGPYDPL
jgi:hypothetical protein